nr:MAG: ORF1 [Torque teno midi virus]
MPFWWYRRKKPWFYNHQRRRYKKTWRRKPRRRPYRRRRFTRTNRRRRRRHRKVRKKRKTLPVRQWQPDSIRNCKIRGYSTLVVGAEGTQMYCYTEEKFNYVPPKVPWGGGIGVENYTLKYLYEELIFHNNFWTASNVQKDLCRYLRCKIILFRHPTQDFVVVYDRQPPFKLTKWTYPSCHPHQMLLQKHKKILLSLKSKPNGKYYKKLIIKPPKQMLSKWFFTKSFCTESLFLLKGAVANFRNSYLSATNENRLVNIMSLNTKFYQHSNWAQARQQSTPYLPYTNAPTAMRYKIKKKDGTTQDLTMDITTYDDSISYDKGWFKTLFLQAFEIPIQSTHAATIPMLIARYNPNKDTGEGNKIFIKSVLTDGWVPPSTDKQLEIDNVPLWLGLLGFLSYVKETKNIDYLKSSVVVLKSQAIHCSSQIGSCDLYCPIDTEYILGKKPYEQVITQTQKTLWYPTTEWQLKTLNAIVESGPYIPKLSEEKESTWELKYMYNFFFKWGGPHTPDKEITNPENFNTYDVPDTITRSIQITNPEKNTTETILHPWDFRRGIVKESALKRMCDHLDTDTEFQFSTEEAPQKKRKIQGAALQHPQKETEEIYNCLHGLCEKNSFPQEEEKTLEALIQQQQQQQELLKYNILQLLMDLRERQKQLQLHTGMLH